MTGNSIGEYNGMDYNHDKPLKDGCFAFIVEVAVLATLIVGVITCSGCSTHRRVDRTTEIIKLGSDTAIAVSSTSHTSSEDRLEQWKKLLDGRQNVKLTIYDTSLPVDIETGRAPVIADLEMATVINVRESYTDSTNVESTEEKSEESFEGHRNGEEQHIRNRESWDNEPDNGIMVFGVMIALAAIVYLLGSGFLGRIIRKLLQ